MHAAAPYFHLSRPFTRKSLQAVRNALQLAQQIGDTASMQTAPGKAAVLIPLANVQNTPGILLEVRGKALRSHSGEVSFPGGRVDPTDASLVDAALRETREELGIEPVNIEILGSIGPPEINLRGNMIVHPVVGFVHADPATSRSSSVPGDDEPLPSCDLTAIRKNISPVEVDAVFHLPLSSLISPPRLRSSLFRGNRPYWAIGVTDLVEEGVTERQQRQQDEFDIEDDSEIGAGKYGIEVWGLTGWYLNLLMKRLKVYE
ncbi:hypothetical protein GYMLUDRAFT_567083 [Collybiopsis luxurians FD-317 M1]|uniref:Unplaced genomic scaffold GYMLUscaffold_22, whole genome shotgun sequence n=1 Tax=Collybiopsis luxurians FD-317 M1 TaxID=944289 RepID=A0A0D0CYT8_9AGAR|nr:hypothetical protein GYMLUDRAFT_567083 [Collybiopsis luxurians FD-317 M1]